CPFCGGEARYNRKQMSQGCVLIGYDCEQCGAAASVFTGPAAIEKSMKISAANAWNRRAEPENKPLTLEKLRKMDGEPVWYQTIPAGTYGSRRTICYGEDLKTYLTPQILLSSGYYEQSNYGKTWLAYAHKPEEGEKG
ncbi:MAG TPA: hypothetical protein DG942_03880, partial [Ruminococcaceae bacterium]|nr:hypothetical protein [Oscillospiraceae bacterium]